MKLVEYSCGCVGFEPDDDGRAYIVEVCDPELCCTQTYGMWRRPQRHTDYRTITSDRRDQIAYKLARLIADGYALREIQQRLCPTPRPS